VTTSRSIEKVAQAKKRDKARPIAVIIAKLPSR